MKITLLTGKIFDIEKELGFPIKIKKSNSIRRISLRVDAKDRIPVLSLPLFCSTKKAVEFVRSHQLWLNNQLKKIPEKTKFKNGEKISFIDQEIEIRHDETLKSGVFIKDGIMFVSGKKEFLHRRVKDFIKAEIKKELTRRSKEKAAEIVCKLNDVVIKDTKTRWGSCSSKNNINYSWRIALAPESVIDYLVSHEVAHLKHQDHSRDFWNCVKKLCPKYIEGRNWLKNKGKELYAYE